MAQNLSTLKQSPDVIHNIIKIILKYYNESPIPIHPNTHPLTTQTHGKQTLGTMVDVTSTQSN
jgi:hypothetical protein